MILHSVSQAALHMDIALLWIIPFIILLGACSYFDIKFRKIPNLISSSLILAGLLLHTIFAGWSGLLRSSIGLAIGLGVFLLLYILNMMGAGDVKLMAGIGAVLGSPLIVPTIVYTILCGGLLALYYSAVAVYRNRISRRDTLNQAQKQSIPYGLAMAMGTIFTLIKSYPWL